MSKFFHINIIATIFLGFLTSSCKGKNENFDIDLSDFKIQQKTDLKVSKPEISDSSETKNKIIKNELKNYQNKSEVLSSIILGKIDPFSREETKTKVKLKVNNLNTNIKLTGFLNTKNNKYVFVNYLGRTGTISEDSIGGINTTLLPNGAKVLNINSKKLKLIINFENEDHILEL